MKLTNIGRLSSPLKKLPVFSILAKCRTCFQSCKKLDVFSVHVKNRMYFQCITKIGRLFSPCQKLDVFSVLAKNWMSFQLMQNIGRLFNPRKILEFDFKVFAGKCQKARYDEIQKQILQRNFCFFNLFIEIFVKLTLVRRYLTKENQSWSYQISEENSQFTEILMNQL